MHISRVNKCDLDELLNLYKQLHDEEFTHRNKHLEELWHEILTNRNYYILVGKVDDKIIASLTLVIVPNLTHNCRPYALIENVITDRKHRSKGFMGQLFSFAKDIAKEKQCYKIMLMTGSKEDKTLNFYKNAGYNSEDKTGFIRWL